jgi:two-component system, OmpR family, phosphate regulon response regulator OmpR
MKRDAERGDGEVRVLVVDDDPGLRALLTEYLAAQGMQADAVADGVALRAWLQDGRADVVIMDLMLPGEDGLALTRWLKAETALPVIMLSARGEAFDRIIGLEVGADDYLAKPFEPRELLARIRAVLRRGQAVTAASAPALEGGLYFGPFRLETVSRRLFRGADEVALSAAEFTLLEILATHPNRVLSRDQIMDWLKGYERDAFDRSIDVRVSRLRGKIEPDPAHPVFLRTVWGQGYLFVPTGAA